MSMVSVASIPCPDERCIRAFGSVAGLRKHLEKTGHAPASPAGPTTRGVTVTDQAFACDRPGCSKTFTTQHGLDVHRGAAHKDEPPPASEEPTSTRCDQNPLCRRGAGHGGRCFPRSESEVGPRRRVRRPPAAPAPEPAADPNLTEPEAQAIVTNGSVRLGRHELEALAGALEERAARLREIAAAGETFELSGVSS
jgi:hypothetical protein